MVLLASSIKSSWVDRNLARFQIELKDYNSKDSFARFQESLPE